MATSESDDFESADEEMSRGASARRNVPQARKWTAPATVDSDSDDDSEYVRHAPNRNSAFREKSDRYRTSAPDGTADARTPVSHARNSQVAPEKETSEAENETCKKSSEQDEPVSKEADGVPPVSVDSNKQSSPGSDSVTTKPGSGETRTRPRKGQELRQAGTKKLGMRIAKSEAETMDSVTSRSPTDERKDSTEKNATDDQSRSGDKDEDNNRLSELRGKGQTESNVSSSVGECTEMDMPEELKSDKKFKEIFKPEGWEGLGNNIELSEELTEDKVQPILDKLTCEDTQDSFKSWGGWGTWGVSSLINTATAGVSTLTSHVTHGLTLLEESMGVPDPSELAKTIEEEDTAPEEKKVEDAEEQQISQSSFGFGNLLSGVSSITKLVESTGSKVVSGGLDTLEAIGKKTMEVLQEGDPGLKKKRAFFLNEADKPILSQVLREAKEKADAAEKTLEEKEMARKVHFESLFNDYQGLVHLEALELLSKQSNIKIQQYLINLESNELISVQETLEEVKELCDLGEEEEDDEENCEKDLKTKLEDACKDLGVNITYEKLCSVWDDTNSYLEATATHSDRDIYQRAMTTLAQFTAFAIERFHKTAALLLIKERRSTVNEADSLVQLTRILSSQIGTLANAFCNSLNEFTKIPEKSDIVGANITTIFLEATNASSYIQDAFRLLIPILQVGAI